MTRKELVLFVLLQLFFLTLFFPYHDVVSGFITGGLLLACLLFNPLKEKIRLFKERKFLWWMMLFFAWMAISALTSKNSDEILPTLDPRLALGYLPVAIGLLNLRKDYRDQVLLGFAFLTVLVCLACLIYSIRAYLSTGNIDFLYNDALTLLTTQQSIYISMFVNISIDVLVYFLFFKVQRFRLLLSLAILFLFVISYLLASRNLMLVLYASALAFIIYYFFRKRNYRHGLLLLATLMLAGFLVLKFFPKTLNRFRDIAFTQFNYHQEGKESHYSQPTTADQWNGANFRIAAWKCGWELFKEYPITGAHLADKQDRLMEKYREKNFQFAISTKKNLHNNYLDILVSMGLIGLALFLMGWLILPLKNMIGQKDYLGCIVLVSFAIAMVTEVYFDRSLGGMLFAFFVPFLLTIGSKQERVFPDL